MLYLFVCLCVRQETLKQRGNIRGGKGPSNEFVCVFFHLRCFICLFVCVSAKRFSNRGGMYKGGKGPARCRTNGAGRAKISLSWRTLVSQLFTTLGLQLQLQFQTILGLVQLATVSDNYQAKWGGPELFVSLSMKLFAVSGMLLHIMSKLKSPGFLVVYESNSKVVNILWMAPDINHNHHNHCLCKNI